jgi:hypothetical protein
LRELEGDELYRLLPSIRQSVRVSTRQPLHVSGFELSRHGTLAFNITAEFEITHSHEQMRSFVMVAWDHAAWLHIELAHSDAVLDEQDVLRAPIEDV